MFDYTFETERLLARPWTFEDVPAALAMYADPEVTRYIGSQPVGSLDQAHERVTSMIARYTSFGPPFMAHALIEKSTGSLVGTTLLKPIPISPGFPPSDPLEIEIGWHLARPHWGRGLATEAGVKLVDYAFGHLDRDELVAVVDPANERSKAVARRLGMTLRGLTRRYYDLETECYVIRRPGAG